MSKDTSPSLKAPKRPAVKSKIEEESLAGTSVSSHTRWKEIAEAVQRNIEDGVLSVGDLLPSETALTKEWKVSRMTAHRAMQELQRNGLVTRQRGRGTLVASTAPKATGNIAMLFHSPLDRLEIEYMRGITTELADEHQVIFCDAHADFDRELRYLERMQKEADGIICMPMGNPAAVPTFRKIVESGYPLVCVDRVPEGVSIDGVVSDNYGATVAALEMLLKRGHKSIAHFTRDEMPISAVRERYDAFLHVMREAGEANPERLVRFFPTTNQKSFEGMVQMMHDSLFTLRHQSNPPTAIFCVNDYCLMVALAAIERLEINVPDEMEVLSFHDALTLMPSLSARLHHIVQDPRQMGQIAAKRLKQRLINPQLSHEIARVPAALYSLQAEFPSDSDMSATNGSSNFPIPGVATLS